MVNPIRLEAGRRYTLVLECYGIPMTGSTHLSWSSDGLPPRVIPSSVLYPVSAAAARGALDEC